MMSTPDTMFVGAPVLDESGKVIAAFTFRINPVDDFATILQQARIGETGETYAFDRQGLLLSSSRFDEQLQSIGLIKKIEESIPRLLASARVARLDSDSASGRKRAYQILSGFASGKSNLLLGTQMVTKGLDFPGVTLVGVLSADFSMDLPDFRASEKTFARLLQVAGRSGRVAPGEVLIQTYYPESELIDDAARQDYESFWHLGNA